MHFGPKSQTHLIALHGFLGLASDWDEVGLDGVEAVDLWTDVGDDLPHWAYRFNTEIREMNLRPVILGYSMGGRLAMEAVLQAPDLYRGAIFVSANPGLKTASEREARWQSDLQWAERIRKEPWSQWLQDWNAQPVLRSPVSGTARSLKDRKENDFDRERLAMAMTNWSLARQSDFREKLAALKMPVLFVSGSEDSKFTELLRSLPLAPSQRHLVIENAGHRVPWDQPQTFANAVREFLAGVV